MEQQPQVGQGLLIVNFSGSHSDTPHSVELLWSSDQPVVENSTWQHSQPRDIHEPGGILNRNLNKWTAANPRLIILRPPGEKLLWM
jgi:hypothetical protein